jgi:hypothetical protein
LNFDVNNSIFNESFEVFVESIQFVLLLGQGWQLFGDSFDIVHMPLGFEVLALIG